MNTATDLRQRLLHLYPIKLVKDYFQLSGSADDVVNTVTTNKTPVAILQFAEHSFFHTKQDIYLLHLGKTYKPPGSYANFPLKVENAKNLGNSHIIFCTARVTYSVYLSSPTDKEDLVFLQPVMITIIRDVVIIQFTKLKKNEKTYYPVHRLPKVERIANNEKDLLQEMITYFSSSYSLSPLDINKGIKHLWKIDWIDAYGTLWIDSLSTNRKNMHEQKLLKQNSPTEYIEIVKKPLGKTAFSYLLNNGYFCETFAADPTAGFVSISRSPKDPNQVSNVINTILQHN